MVISKGPSMLQMNKVVPLYTSKGKNVHTSSALEGMAKSLLS